MYPLKRLTILCGHYGSGKTNVAVNVATELRKSCDTVAVADLDKIIATLKDFGVLKSDRPGKYVVTKKKIKNDSVTLLLLKAAMKSSGEHYYSIPSLSNMSVLFPFEYTPKMEVLLNDKSITNSSFDGKVSFMIS